MIPTKLNFGCGRDIKQGYWNVDVANHQGVNHVFNFDRYPYPFFDETFKEILCKDVLEHLEKPLEVLGELHRILERGGVLFIRVPHYSSSNAFSDLTHRHFLGYRSFHVFEEKNPYHFYIDYSFQIKRQRLTFGKRYAFWNYLVEPLANAFPRFYEDTFLHSLFPALNIEMELVKE